jgi:hypothetical protein
MSPCVVPGTVSLSNVEEKTMRNLFVYAPHDSAAFRQVENLLHNQSLFARLVTLPPGSQFSSLACLDLRSNDVIILVAENEADIDHLLEFSDEYQSFRIILVIPTDNQPPSSKYQLLTPRLLAYLDGNLDELVQYLKKVFKPLS